MRSPLRGEEPGTVEEHARRPASPEPREPGEGEKGEQVEGRQGWCPGAGDLRPPLGSALTSHQVSALLLQAVARLPTLSCRFVCLTCLG